MTRFVDPSVLFIGGLDPGGRAGLLRDAQVASFYGRPTQVFVTALTAQNDARYDATLIPDNEFFEAAWRAVLSPDVATVKIGMLASGHVVEFLSARLSALRFRAKNISVVWDPVLVSSSGGKLLDDAGLTLIRKNEWLACVDLITPNAIEAAFLLDQNFDAEISVETLARALFERYGKAVCVKGGHTKQPACDAFFDGQDLVILESPLWSRPFRGTGCAFAAAIACHRAAGATWVESCHQTKRDLAKILGVG